VKGFNEWYDGLDEPWRFLFMLAIFCPLWLGLALANVPSIVIGAVMLIVALLLRMT